MIEAGRVLQLHEMGTWEKRRLEQNENPSAFSEPKRITCHETLKKKVRANKNLLNRLEMAGCNDKIQSSRSCLREGNGTPLQYSCLENPMDGGAWWATAHGVARSRTWLYNFQVDNLSNFTFTFHFHALEKEMASHSSVPAWRIPGTGEPGGLPSMGSHRVRQTKAT